MVEDIIKANRDVIVIVDEAYIDFAGRSAVELIGQYDNLIVVQTFSKARSMAGMRIGYAIATYLSKNPNKVSISSRVPMVILRYCSIRSLPQYRTYAIASPRLIRYLNDAKYSFNSYTMNQTALICGVEAVKDREYFEEGRLLRYFPYNNPLSQAGNPRQASDIHKESCKAPPRPYRKNM